MADCFGARTAFGACALLALLFARQTDPISFLITMNVGHMHKSGFQMLLNHGGCTVLIHKNWGTPHGLASEQRGLKNSEKNNRNKVMFQFPEAVEIQPGDVLQQKGTRDLWRVTDVEDHVIDDVYVNFEAKVEKFTGSAMQATSGRSQVFVQGSVYGAIQLNSPHAAQNVSVQVLQVDENIRALRNLLQKAEISELEKEEANHALDRISQLARKDRSSEVLAKIKEKVDIVRSVFDLAKDIAGLAAPYIGAIAQSF